MAMCVSRTLLSAAYGVLYLAIGHITSAVAGGRGCDSAGRECYEKVAVPDMYSTIARQVVVQPARTEVVRQPAVVMQRLERVEVVPGRWQRETVPAQYGSVERSVLVQQASVSYSVAPAQYRKVDETVVVRPASWRWERQVDRHGRETMCKVAVPAVTRIVSRQVMAAGAQKIAHTTPAVYQTVRQSIEMAPARVRHTYVPGSYAYVQRAVVVRAAQDRVVMHPAVTSIVHEKVLVQKGGTKWQRTSGFWH